MAYVIGSALLAHFKVRWLMTMMILILLDTFPLSSPSRSNCDIPNMIRN